MFFVSNKFQQFSCLFIEFFYRVSHREIRFSPKYRTYQRYLARVLHYSVRDQRYVDRELYSAFAEHLLRTRSIDREIQVLTFVPLSLSCSRDNEENTSVRRVSRHFTCDPDISSTANAFGVDDRVVVIPRCVRL